LSNFQLLVNCQDDDLTVDEKKIKLRACMKLSTERMIKDNVLNLLDLLYL